jgi:hypothetical protein
MTSTRLGPQNQHFRISSISLANLPRFRLDGRPLSVLALAVSLSASAPTERGSNCEQGGALRLCGLSDECIQALHICRLDQALPHFPTREEAVCGRELVKMF